MWILGLPYALVIGMVIAVTALIPIAGGYIGCTVGVFLLLIEDPVQALVFVVVFLVLQQIEGKLIYPKVVGNFVGLPGIWILVAITVGGSLFGVVGMLVFIPLMATAYSLIRESVNKRNRIKETQ
jgi:predicted PurR-regulated permease PerM